MTCCWHTKIHIIVTLIVLIGALNWGAEAFCQNLVVKMSKNLNHLFQTKLCYNRYIYIIVAICGLILASKRHTWYPYSSESILPEYTVALHTPPKANKKIVINVKPNSKVIYWSGNYDKWESDINVKLKEKNHLCHSGVVMSDEFGNANILFEDYDDLDKSFKHLHYRVLGYSHHLMSDIKKIYY